VGQADRLRVLKSPIPLEPQFQGHIVTDPVQPLHPLQRSELRSYQVLDHLTSQIDYVTLLRQLHSQPCQLAHETRLLFCLETELRTLFAIYLLSQSGSSSLVSTDNLLLSIIDMIECALASLSPSAELRRHKPTRHLPPLRNTISKRTIDYLWYLNIVGTSVLCSTL
jgi:hypothetical protein